MHLKARGSCCNAPLLHYTLLSSAHFKAHSVDPKVHLFEPVMQAVYITETITILLVGVPREKFIQISKLQLDKTKNFHFLSCILNPTSTTWSWPIYTKWIVKKRKMT